MAAQKQKKMRHFREDRPHLRSEGLRKSKGLENRLVLTKKKQEGPILVIDLEVIENRCKPRSMLGLVKCMQKIAGNSLAMAA